jgi:hypothetical protein
MSGEAALFGKTLDKLMVNCLTLNDLRFFCFITFFDDDMK